MVVDLDDYEETYGRAIKQYAESRPPPLTPADIEVVLKKKSFTSRNADEKKVAKLYEELKTSSRRSWGRWRSC
eukprot:1605544-Prymnesium_polylepis.1